MIYVLICVIVQCHFTYDGHDTGSNVEAFVHNEMYYCYADLIWIKSRSSAYFVNEQYQDASLAISIVLRTSISHSNKTISCVFINVNIAKYSSLF